MRFHRLQNVQIALDFLKQRQVSPVPPPGGESMVPPPILHLFSISVLQKMRFPLLVALKLREGKS